MSRVLAAIAQRARLDDGAIALSDHRLSFTYGALETAIETAARELLQWAPLVCPGSPVAIRLPNGPAWVILDLALTRLGWTSLPLPGFFTDEQRQHAMADAGASLLIEAARAVHGDIDLAGVALRVTPLALAPRVLPKGTAKITYTSGSTGQPKGVCLSREHMEAVAASLVLTIGADYAGTHLPLLPLSILLENVAGLYTTLLAGGRYHILPADQLGLADPFRPDLPRLAAAIAEEGASSLILVPELLRALMMVMTFTGVRLPALKLVAVGGAKVSPSLLSRADDLGLPVYEGYGLSECASVVALNTPAHRKAGTVGRPLPHLGVTIDDGEIIVEGSGFLGYAGGATHEGPVRTGDLGAIDADGFLGISGRRTNTIITSHGRNVAPEWVESELTAQPEIRQAVVLGEAQAELSALIVPLIPGMDEAAIASAVARANANLPPYAQVGRWLVRDAFDAAAGELTNNGRPRRAALSARHRDFMETSTTGDFA
ncbi:AMP-binding protein [Caulobacter sp. X]|uniref:AMP-binding protein n=1 Tax=Caulobacter sp. X TaxID=2048901 RepID=UPI000C1574BE|nr:AMP-binding protein [Caulobacter sp. X]PIC00976.1 AMP-dependent synthetase [Caulobacter sp. X]